MKRLASAVDGNQRGIVASLRSVGAFVQHLHSVGDGCPDLLVGRRGVWTLLEVKDPRQPFGKRALTPDEAKWHRNARFLKLPVFVVETSAEALLAIGVLERRSR